MSAEEARAILVSELEEYRLRSFGELVRLMDGGVHSEVIGSSGTVYQLEIDAWWDNPDKPGEVLRVAGAIDGGDIDARTPMCDDFLINAMGEFIDE